MRFSAVAGAVLAIAAAHSCVYAQNRVTIALYNCAELPDSILAPAIATARRAFAVSRIESRWVRCDSQKCSEALPADSYLELFVVPRLLLPIMHHSIEETAGFAMPHGFAHPRGYAVYSAARIAADRNMRPTYVVLACILLHEAGHLLGLHHQANGVMRANLDGDDMDRATMGRAFNSDERSRLRAGVASLARVEIAHAPGLVSHRISEEDQQDVGDAHQRGLMLEDRH